MRVMSNMVGNINTFRVDFSKKLHAQKSVSFGDSFISQPQVIFGEIPETNEIIDTIKSSKELGSGFSSIIYRFKDKIVKVPKDRVFNNDFERYYTQGQNVKEYFALDKIKNIDPSIATNPAGIIRNKNSYYLVEEFVKGSHPEGNNFTISHVKDLFSKFFKLDSNGIYNCDLQTGNIFLTGESKTKLIDFGSFNFIDNTGRILGSDYIPADSFMSNWNIFKETNLDFSKRFLNTFFQPKYPDFKNLADNPYLNVPSNSTNFEFRTMYLHLLDENVKNPLEFFKEYLKSKSEYYHGEMKNFLQGLNFKDIDTAAFEHQKVEAAKTNLRNAVDYEGLIKDTLANPTDDVVKVELAKLQLRTFSYLEDSLNSPVNNSAKLQDAYTQLVTVLEDGIKNSEGNKKEYFTQTLDYFKSNFDNYNFVQGQVPIPDNENLIKVLFDENVKKLTPKFNKKVAVMIWIGAVATVGIAALAIKKVKKNKAKNLANNASVIEQNGKNDVASIPQINIVPKVAQNLQTSTINNTSCFKTEGMPDVFLQFKI